MNEPWVGRGDAASPDHAAGHPAGLCLGKMRAAGALTSAAAPALKAGMAAAARREG